MSNLIVHTLIAFLFILGDGQKHVDPSMEKDFDPIVTLHSGKTVYRSGEPLHIEIKLVNRGSTTLWIRKDSLDHRLGNPGLLIVVKAVKRFGGTPGCTVGGIAGEIPQDSRSPEQQLNEDFLSLHSLGFIGHENGFTGDCLAMEGGGIFEMTGFYYPGTYKNQDVAKLKELPGILLSTAIQSQPLTITILPPTNKVGAR